MTLSPWLLVPSVLQHLLYGNGSRSGGRNPVMQLDLMQPVIPFHRRGKLGILPGSQVRTWRGREGPLPCQRKRLGCSGTWASAPQPDCSAEPEAAEQRALVRKSCFRTPGFTSQGPLPMTPESSSASRKGTYREPSQCARLGAQQ